MPDLLIRGLDSTTVATLKRRAERHHTSLQGEVKTILERTARIAFSDSADLIREDRDR